MSQDKCNKERGVKIIEYCPRGTPFAERFKGFTRTNDCYVVSRIQPSEYVKREILGVFPNGSRGISQAMEQACNLENVPWDDDDFVPNKPTAIRIEERTENAPLPIPPMAQGASTPMILNNDDFIRWSSGWRR